MLKNRFFRSAALCVATLVGAGTVSVLGATAAMAASGGAITVTPVTGQDTTVLTVSTPAACPTTDASVQAVLTGGNFPTSPIVFALNKGPISAWPTNASGGLNLTLSNSMRTLASDASVPLLDPGTPTNGTKYTIDVQCEPQFGASDEDFSGNIWFTSETTFQTTDPSQPAPPTTTTLAATPVSPVVAGTPVTLKASVLPATAAGTVTFFDGATALGAAVSVTGGSASLVTTGLGIGTHAITATFTPTNPALNATSTSTPPLAYSVSAAPAVQTFVSLLVAQGTSAEQFSEVSLNATVSPTAAAGSVQFFDGATSLGIVAAANGAATLSTSTLALGAHSFTAVFTPTSSAAYITSAPSTAIPFQVTAFTGSSSSETITTTVLPGSLVISIPNQQVTLPSPVLNSSGNLFTTSGALQPITVTDNRAGNPGWTVSGLVNAFSDGTTQISAENLGWTPTAATGSPGQTINEGPVVNPANGVAPSDTGTLGLSTSQTLASTGAGFGLGTAHLGANLLLNVPTTTTAGTYTATLTLTAI